VSTSSRATRLEGAGVVLAVVVCAALAWPLRHYVTDDTFIHLQYARHVARGQGFVFNPGEHVYGSTSPLWVLLLADAIAMGVDGLLAAKLLGAAATLAALLLWARLVRRTVASPWLRVLSTLAWASHAWMLRWSLSGMETPLAVALVLGGLVAFTATEPWGERPEIAGLLWALAALARPECALLVALWMVLSVADHGPRAAAVRAVRGLWPAALVYGGWLAFARGYFGTFWPNTLAAKAAGGEGAAYQIEQLTRQGAIVATTDGVLVIVLCAALATLSVRGERPRLRPAVRFLPWTWLIAVPLVYALRGVPVLSRYLVPLLPVLGWLAWRTLDRVLAPVPVSASPAIGDRPQADLPRHARVALFAGAVIATLVLGQNLYIYARIVRPQVESFSAGMNRSLIPWGRWFDRHAAPDAVIAAPDIGALGYYGGRRVVDLAGLVTPEMVPILRRMPQEDATARFEFARFSRPEFVVDRAGRPWDLGQRSPWGAALVPLGHASLPNLGVSRPREAVYSFYRIDWAVYDSLAASR
jgi:arabinofuranosyltransferase